MATIKVQDTLEFYSMYLGWITLAMRPCPIFFHAWMRQSRLQELLYFCTVCEKKCEKKRFCTSPKVASNVVIRILVLFCLRMSTIFQQGKLKKFKTGQLRCKCKYAELSCHKYVTAGFEICTFTILGVLTNNVWNTYNSWRTVCNINLDFMPFCTGALYS